MAASRRSILGNTVVPGCGVACLRCGASTGRGSHPTQSGQRSCLLWLFLPASHRLRRVSADDLLVDLDTPAWPARQDEHAVLDLRRRGYQFVLPWDVLDIDLHDTEVGNCRAHMRAHQRTD